MKHPFRAALLLWALALPVPAKQVVVTVLATTDLHGNIYPVDYYTERPAAHGLARIATLVREVRRQTSNTLLIDCGDTIQGTPLEAVWQSYIATGSLPLGLKFTGTPPREDPMMAAMNRLGYAAMVVGNHEFNFGLKNLEAARRDARFPWLAANVISSGQRPRPFRPYTVETVAGVKIAIVGLTTAGVPNQEPPEHYAGCRFTDPRRAAESTLARLRAVEHPDLVIAAIHGGLGSAPRAGRRKARRSTASLPENPVLEIASSMRGIDAIVFGHTHRELAGMRARGVLLVQPQNWGGSLARLDFTMDDSSGRWKLVRKTSRLIPVTRRTEADPAILAAARPYQDITEQYLSRPVAESPVDMDGRSARFEDTPLVDSIHTVQMAYAKADISFASLFHPAVRIRKGPVTVRQIAALYLYENGLVAIEGDGRMIKEALENSARFFKTCPDARCSHGPLVNRGVVGFNYDMAEGVEYEIDLRQPAGRRIVNLRRNGRPIAADQKFRIAVNNYRAGGSGGYRMFRGAKVLWKSERDIRSLMIDYYAKHRTLPARATGNWRIIPPQAVRVLESRRAGGGPVILPQEALAALFSQRN